MLQLEPKSWLSWDFTVLQDSQPVGSVDMSSWRERAELSVQDKVYKVYRDSMTGPFVLESDGAVLARAEKPSAFRRCFMVEHAGSTYTLRATSWFGGTFVLEDDSAEVEREIGKVTPEGIFTHRAQVDFPEMLALPVRVFMIWLVVIMWKRQSDSA